MTGTWYASQLVLACIMLFILSRQLMGELRSRNYFMWRKIRKGVSDLGSIYIENVRSLLNITTPEARAICEDGVKRGILIKQIALLCPSQSCSRVLARIPMSDPLPTLIECELCEHDGEELYGFAGAELPSMDVYQMVKGK